MLEGALGGLWNSRVLLFIHEDTEALDWESDLAMVTKHPGPDALRETQSLLPGHDPSSRE